VSIPSSTYSGDTSTLFTPLGLQIDPLMLDTVILMRSAIGHAIERLSSTIAFALAL